MKVSLIQNSSLPGSHDALTIYPYIFMKGGFDRGSIADITLIQHEFIHVRQVRSMGWLPFYVSYLWYALTVGYDKNPYEVIAYAEQATTPLSASERAEIGI